MDAAVLTEALRQNSAAHVARQFGVAVRTVYLWCKRTGIARRTYRCPNLAMLRRLENECLLQKEIARAFGVSRWTIRRWCQRYGIAHSTTGQFRPGTRGNVPAIHEEMPFGIGVLFEEDEEAFNF